MKIYLDNQTTACPSKEVLEAMLPYFQTHYGTPVSPHAKGQELMPALTQAYSRLYALVQAEEEVHFVFTSSGAEAVNHVIMSTYLDSTRKTGKNHFVASSEGEAPAILALERLHELGCVSELAPINEQGMVTAEAIAETITPRTALVSLSWANGLTGVVHPIKEIAAVCRERGIPLHVDASHVLGRGYFTLEESGADFLSFNGDTLPGPKGTGGLFIRVGGELSPFIVGGSEQAGLRAGSFNVPGLMGLSQAAFEAQEASDFLCTECARLRDLFEETLLKEIPDLQIPYRESQRVPHITSAVFPGVTSDALLYSLNQKGVYASFGGGNFQQIKHLLKTYGKESHSGLSFALSCTTTEKEIEKASEIIIQTVQHLRKYSQNLR